MKEHDKFMIMIWIKFIVWDNFICETIKAFYKLVCKQKHSAVVAFT